MDDLTSSPYPPWILQGQSTNRDSVCLPAQRARRLGYVTARHTPGRCPGCRRILLLLWNGSLPSAWSLLPAHCILYIHNLCSTGIDEKPRATGVSTAYLLKKRLRRF